MIAVSVLIRAYNDEATIFEILRKVKAVALVRTVFSRRRGRHKNRLSVVWSAKPRAW